MTLGYAQEPDHLVLSEIMAANDQTLFDSNDEASDWIEIWNHGEAPIDLGGWFLTDTEESPKEWAFPSMTLSPGDYLVVFASGADRRAPGEELHTNFRLDREGEYLALTHSSPDSPEGIIVTSEFAPYPEQRTDFSYGLPGGLPSDAIGYFKSPTPGEPNDADSLTDFVDEPELTVGHGFYSSPVEVEITTTTQGADLIYTTNGSPPGADNGNRVSAPDPQTPPSKDLTISETTTLRVVATKPGLEPSEIATATYLFPEQVMKQDGEGPPFSMAANWGHAGPDWELDPEILNHGNPAVRPEAEDLKRLPTISLVTGFDQLFGDDGIYIAGESDERPASMEMLNPEADTADPNAANGFQADGTVQIVGGSSPNRWKSDKLSMRFKFQPDLEYPVFGDSAAERFDTLVIDARLNNTWHYGGGVEPQGQRNRAQYVRDQYAANLHNAMGGTSPHGQHVHVYLNGIYWGIHTLHERPDDNFAASYFGGKNEHYDSLKHNPSDLLQGSSENYLRLHELANRNLRENANYEAVREMLAIPSFIRYMLVNYYVGNRDWAHHNWYASYNRTADDGRWRFHSWDAEKGLHGVLDNVTGRNDDGAPTNLHHDLVANREYRLQFADMAYQALRHGVLSPERAAPLYREITDDIDLAMRLESARWGDNHREPPFTRLDWLETRSRLFGETGDVSDPLYDYFSRRSEVVLQQFRDRGWLPAAEPPTFNRHGGHVAEDFLLRIDASSDGTLFYTLDGSDPRVPSQGGKVTRTTLVPADAPKRAIVPAGNGIQSDWFRTDFDAGDWPTGTKGAGYDNNNDYADLIDPALDFKDRVTPTGNETIYMRVPFHVEDPSAFDNLELSVRYDDGYVAYLNGVEIARANAPGDNGSTVAWDDTATENHSDGLAVNFQTVSMTQGISALKTGENVLAIHGLNVNPSSSDSLIWPRLDGVEVEGGTDSAVADTAREHTGPISLEESTVVNARLRDGTEWSPLAQAEFIVGTVQPSPANLVLSRIHYHPAPATQDEATAGFESHREFEFLELLNIGKQTIDLRGLRFGDGIDFEFDTGAAALELAPGKSFLLVSNRAAFRHRYGEQGTIVGELRNGTNLDNGGERVAAISPDGTEVIDVTYDDGPPWPEQPDGQGYSLALRDPTTNPDGNDPASWEEHTEAGAGSSPSPLQNWLKSHFSEAELNQSSISGLGADPDSDGRPNALEFFHATDPRVAQATAKTLAIRQDPAAAGSAIHLSFVKRAEVGDLTWKLASSSDLSTWTAVPMENLTVTGTDPDGPENVQLSLRPEVDARFFRLELTH